MNSETMSEFRPVIGALHRLVGEFPHLPTAAFSFGTVVYRGRVEAGVDITRHGSFADFEAWREALGIDPATVTWKHSSTDHGPYELLVAEGTFAGVPVVLSGFTSMPAAPAPVTAPAT